MTKFKLRGNVVLVSAREIKKESNLIVPTSVADDPGDYQFIITDLGKDVPKDSELEVGQEIMLFQQNYNTVTMGEEHYLICRPGDILCVVERDVPVNTYTYEESIERANIRFSQEQAARNIVKGPKLEL